MVVMVSREFLFSTPNLFSRILSAAIAASLQSALRLCHRRLKLVVSDHPAKTEVVHLCFFPLAYSWRSSKGSSFQCVPHTAVKTAGVIRLTEWLLMGLTPFIAVQHIIPAQILGPNLPCTRRGFVHDFTWCRRHCREHESFFRRMGMR